MKRLSATSSVPFSIKDFAYPVSSSLHFGIYPTDSPTSPATSKFPHSFPCTARALYDFDAEDSSEMSFKEGDLIDVSERKAVGWLSGTLGRKKGLIPETYVRIEDGKLKSNDSNSPSKLSPDGSNRRYSEKSPQKKSQSSPKK